jgi:hypothetical protein
MINIETELFSSVADKVRAEYPDIFMTGEYVKSPPSFPAASLVEMDNSVYTSTQTSTEIENHASLMYELDVYSNKIKGKKSECKAIATLIDKEMTSLGFTRVMLQPIPNMDDATIYRVKGRYKAVVSKENVIYRR